MRLDHEMVRWHRDRHGWTLDTLAEKAEVAKGTVLRAEHGEDVRPSSGRRIANALGTEISELIPNKPGVPGRREPALVGKDEGPETGPSHNEAIYEKAIEEHNQRRYGPSIIAQGWDRLAERWTQRLEKGNFEQRELEILLETLEYVAAGMEANAEAERKQLVASYGANAAGDMSLLRPTINRLGLLVGKTLKILEEGSGEVSGVPHKPEMPDEEIPDEKIVPFPDRFQKEAS
jgi:transcriptional regulator with XRE-family HTH domain